MIQMEGKLGEFQGKVQEIIGPTFLDWRLRFSGIRLPLTLKFDREISGIKPGPNPLPLRMGALNTSWAAESMVLRVWGPYVRLVILKFGEAYPALKMVDSDILDP